MEGIATAAFHITKRNYFITQVGVIIAEEEREGSRECSLLNNNYIAPAAALFARTQWREARRPFYLRASNLEWLSGAITLTGAEHTHTDRDVRTIYNTKFERVRRKNRV